MSSLRASMGEFLRRYGLRVFGPTVVCAVLAGVSRFLMAAGFLDLIASAQGYNFGVVSIMEWLANPPLLFLGVLALYTFGSLAWSLKRYTSGLRKKFEEERDNLRGERDTLLRELAPRAYATWAGGSPLPAVFSRFIETVRFPDGLPFRKGQIGEYAIRTKAAISGDRKELLDFCIAIYSEGRDSILDSISWGRFHEARMRLSKFWNKWGYECFEDRSIQKYELRLDIVELMFLVYLEIALALRNGDRTNGKQWLFRLARETYEEQQTVTKDGR